MFAKDAHPPLLAISFTLNSLNQASKHLGLVELFFSPTIITRKLLTSGSPITVILPLPMNRMKGAVIGHAAFCRTIFKL